ncbi:MAG: ABC transporter permease [Actinobacteria bacterium]|nr:ABC transporter permease [Actinomycetota bacterium]MBL7123842.1 ABC transporter permease [Actinomycetota bacterium]
MKKELIGVYTIWLRDIKRYFRDKPRIIGSFAQPILFLFVLGTGIASSFSTFGGGGGKDFLNFMFPGIVGMTVLFTSFFSAMSIVWDREFGFLREVLVTPISRASIVVGKLLGGSTIALIQGSIILLFSPLLKIPITFAIFFKVLVIMFLVAITISAMGIVLASVIKSMQAFQVITNFLLMPMFFLSGALFPLNNTVKWMNVVSKINPLSYGIDAMRTMILNNPALQLYPLWLDIMVLVSVTLVMSILGAFLFSRQE